MATKKSSPAKKKQAAKKKTAAKKKSTNVTKTPVVQDELENKSVEETPTYQEEEIQPSMPPVYTSQSQQETGSNSLLRYIILAALILVGVVAYTIFSKKQEPYKPEPKSSEAKPAKPIEPPQPKKEEVAEKTEEPKPQETSTPVLAGYAVGQLAENKSFAEASQYCKSLGYKLPKAAELRKIEKFPDSLKNAELWTADVTNAKEALRFNVNAKKALYTDKNTKLSVLCKTN